MSKPILYFGNLSAPCRAVVLTAVEIGLELNIQKLDFTKGEHMSPEFLKKNPQHTIPTLDDNGVYLFDSHVICSYLVDKYAKNDKLYPKDLVKRSVVNTRLFFEASYMFPRLLNIVLPVVFESRSEDFTAESKDYMSKAYDILEAFLEDGPYVCGGEMTIADFSLVAIVTNVNVLVPLDSGKHAKIIKWIKLMEKLPYYENANKKGAAYSQEFYLAAQKGKLVDPNCVWGLLAKYSEKK